MRIWLTFVLLTLAPPLAAHPTETPPPEAVPEAATPDGPPRTEIAVPALHWDEQRPGMSAAPDPAWGVALMAAIAAESEMLDTVPEDIEAWCPAYAAAGIDQRAAFWAGLVSVLAWYESTHNPRAIGGGGRWFGLVQIAPATARHRGCAVGSGLALLDPEANLRCGVRIMAQNVVRDGVVARDLRGVAAEWGPFYSPPRRAAMRDWVSSQDYCALPEAD